MKGESDFLQHVKVAYDNKDYAKTINICTKAQGLFPKNVDFVYTRAMSYYHTGNLNDCLTDMDTAQKLQPNNPFRYSSRAYVKNKMGDIDGAIEDYQKAVHLDPDDAVAYNNLGLVLEGKGYAEKARSNFKKADELVGEKYSETNLNQINEINENVPENPTIVQYVIQNFFSVRFIKEFLNFIKNGFRITK